jgi:hypothetical protein
MGMFLLVLGAWLSSSWASLPPHHVAELGNLKLHDSVESIPALRQEFAKFRRSCRHARFLAYYFDSKLPARCMNLECGPFAHRIMAEGGRLLGGADPELAREVGFAEGQPVLVLSDLEGRVTAIYRDVARQELASLIMVRD